MKNKLSIIMFTTLFMFLFCCSKDSNEFLEDCPECEDCVGLINPEDCPECEDCVGLINPEDCPECEESEICNECPECPIGKTDEFEYRLKDGFLQVTGVKSIVSEKIVIPDEAFYEGVKYLVESVNLVNNDYQKELYLGKNIKEIIQLCNIKSIEVSDENEFFLSENGVLYNKEYNKLLLYPALKKDSEFSLDKNIVGIGANAFNGNKYIETLIINSNTIYFNSKSMMNCTNLKYVKYNSDKLSCYISESAFENCYSLKQFTANEIFDIGSYAFKNCYSLEKFEVTDHIIKEIREYAFENCYNLTDFIMSTNSYGVGPDLVLKTNVYNGIFKNCYKLKNINGYIFKNISYDMFYNCYSLEEIVLPNDAYHAYVCEGAFTNCINLTKAVIYANTKTEKNAFVNCNNLIIYAKCKEFSQNWSEGFCDNEIIYS